MNKYYIARGLFLTLVGISALFFPEVNKGLIIGGIALVVSGIGEDSKT